MKQDNYNKITEAIIQKLEKDLAEGKTTPFWERGYSLPNPQNISGHEYRGMNYLMLLGNHALPYYLTFRQCQELGGMVKKGEKSIPVCFWKFFEIIDKESQETELKTIPYLRVYNVFNVSQCTGLPEKYYQIPEYTAKNKIEEAEKIVAEFKDKPEIDNKMGGCNSSYYDPFFDKVHIPDMKFYKSADLYYFTLFHELIHSTAHEKRLNRGLTIRSLDLNNYSQEELVAELGASFLGYKAGINTEESQNRSKEYIKSWIQALKNDTKLIVKASGRAQKACKYILNETEETGTIKEEERRVA